MESRPGGPARFLKTYHLIAVAIVVAVVAVALTGFVWAKKGVTVVVDGRDRLHNSRAEDVRGLLAEARVPVAAGDIVTPSLDTEISDGMTVTVRHAVPVTLRLGSSSLPLRVVGKTVGDALVSAGLRPGPNMHVAPRIDAPLVAGMSITASEAFLRVVQEKREVPFETRVVKDADLRSGGRKVLRPGKPGKVLRVYEVVVSKGREGARILRTQRYLSRPVPQLVAVSAVSTGDVVFKANGTSIRTVSTKPRAMPAVPKGGNRRRMRSSAYAPGYGAGTRTATGARARYGIAAVDPRVIPLGTRLYIVGYGYATAADTGSAIKGDRIDLCFDTGAEARAWGKRAVTVIVLP